MATGGGGVDSLIPMSVKPVDLVGSYGRGFDMRGRIIEQQQVEQQYDRENKDRTVLDDYLKQPDSDLSTAPGVTKALTDLKGKVSSDMYAKLDKHAKTIQENDVKYKTELNSLDESNLKLRAAQMDGTLQYLGIPLQTYDKTLKEKGKADADIEFNQAKQKVLQQAAAQKGPDGQPLYPPEMIKQFQDADPEHLRMLFNATKYHRDQVDEAYKHSQIERNEALGKFDEARANWYTKEGGPKGAKTPLEKLEAEHAAGLISDQEYNAMRQGIIAKASKPGETSTLTPEAVHNAGMDYYLTHNLPPRLSPAERSAILNEAATIAKDNGDTAEETALRGQANKATQTAINDITKRRSLVATFEKDADKRLALILELSAKTDRTGMPALNRWLNAGRKNIEGDEDVNNLNSAMVGAQAELAKVLSGSLGNAGVSDAARAEAQQIINTAMSDGQIKSLVPVLRRELKYKLDSYDETIKELKESQRTPNTQRKNEADHQKVDPAKQAERDTDSKRILKEEYDKVAAELAKMDSKSPETADAYSRKKADLDAARREYIKAGGKASDLDATPAPKAAPAVAKAKDPPLKNAKGWVLHADAKGNQAYVGPKGEIEEVK